MAFCSHCGTWFEDETIGGEQTIPGNGGETMGSDQTVAGPPSEPSGSAKSIGGEDTVAGPAGGSIEREIVEEVIDSRYEVKEVLGAGGMGKVYRCLDRKLNRMVAVKRLLSRIRESEAGIARFLREGQAIANLNHPNIVQIYDIGQDKAGHYIVMEYIEGRTLRGLIGERKKLEPAEIRKIAGQVGAGLAYAHRKKIVHRDIKPGNIMLTKTGVAKITDFGLALLGTESELSMTGQGMGTMDYMPPEQRRDAKHTDHRADIYAFGATLYELATGKPPRTIRESEIPRELREVILKAMEAKPEDRFFSMEDLLKNWEKDQAIEKVSEEEIKEGKCPGCGYKNTLKDRYCQRCGLALFQECPDCGREFRVGIKECPDCGMVIARHKEIEGYLKTAQKLRRQYQFEKVLEMYRAVLKLDDGNDTARRGVEDVTALLKKIDLLNERLSRARKSGNIKEEERCLSELLSYSPDREKEISARLAEINSGKQPKETIKPPKESDSKTHPRRFIYLGIVIMIILCAAGLIYWAVWGDSYKEAKQAYEEAASQYMDIIKREMVTEWRSIALLAEQAQSTEDQAKAQEYYEEAYRRIIGLIQTKNYEEAASDYLAVRINNQKLLNRSKSNFWKEARSLVRTARTEHENGDLESATELYKQAKVGLLKAVKETRKYDKAATDYVANSKQYQDLLDRFGSNSWKATTALAMKAGTEYRNGNLDQAAELYKRAKADLLKAVKETREYEEAVTTYSTDSMKFKEELDHGGGTDWKEAQRLGRKAGIAHRKGDLETAAGLYQKGHKLLLKAVSTVKTPSKGEE